MKLPFVGSSCYSPDHTGKHSRLIDWYSSINLLNNFNHLVDTFSFLSLRKGNGSWTVVISVAIN